MESRTLPPSFLPLLQGTVPLLLVVPLLFPLGLEAGVYKWTDEQGRVHFSDRPVTGESTEVKIKERPASQPPVSNQQERQLKMKRMLDVYEEDRAVKKEADQKQAQERKKRKRNCARAKDMYASHSRASGIYDLGKDGERRFLNDAARTRHMQKLKAEVARWCK
ncbi:MAG: DUF4124 domain-containing protein [Candidatus Thiodiazotropha sp. (ex Dulcina madagascariensis)]|nr:DUF4124 domain-containing protein [Candidatus Thiodiazotropha sp. (ex Dulcina madagascariensis)]MCU7925819.1 DUF4124 domain-containing protein [Candidatus Thiodiazotropha sp. (ex Dulcina madagascariensis)]